MHRLLERGKMEAKIIIYGTETCPFVKGAREDYGDKAIFYNVKTDPERLPKVTLWSGPPSASATEAHAAFPVAATKARVTFPAKQIDMPCAYTRKHLREE